MSSAPHRARHSPVQWRTRDATRPRARCAARSAPAHVPARRRAAARLRPPALPWPGADRQCRHSGKRATAGPGTRRAARMSPQTARIAAMSVAAPQTPLWQPSAERMQGSDMARFMQWAAERRGGTFAGYEQLWRWSVGELEDFWAAVWEFAGVRASRPYERVLDAHRMPGAQWFGGAELNYAHNLLEGPGAGPGRDADQLAVVHASELRAQGELTWGELRDAVAAAAGGMRALGVERGDRVVAYMPNIPETLIAFLAAASIGAVWSSAAPEFGARSVIDRFAQIEPKLLLAIDGYRHGGRDFDRSAVVEEILAELPSVEHVVRLAYLQPESQQPPRRDGAARHRHGGAPERLAWGELLARRSGT